MADFSKGRINSKGILVFPSDNDSLGIEIPTNPTSANPTIQSVGIIQGFNLGAGQGIYTTYELNGRAISGLKSLVAGEGVALSTDNSTITISSTAIGALAGLNVLNLGGGAGLFSKKIAGDIQLRTVQGGGIVAVQQIDDTVVVSAEAVTSVGLATSRDFVSSGSPITSSGVFNLDLSNSGVAPGNYTNPSLTIDAKGRITSAASSSLVLPSVQGGTGINVSAGPTFAVELAPSGVAAGLYSAASLIVDQYGRITNATSNVLPGPIGGSNVGGGAGILKTAANQQVVLRSLVGAGTISVVENSDNITISAVPQTGVTSVNATGANGISVSGGPINSSGNLTIGLNQIGVPGTYQAATISVDPYGRITSAVSNVPGEVNTISNLGSGYGFAAQKVGADLQFKSLVGGPGIVVSATANLIQVGLSYPAQWVFVSEETDAVSYGRYMADTGLGSFAIVLPNNPEEGAWIKIRDYTGSFSSNSLRVSASTSIVSHDPNLNRPSVNEIDFSASFLNIEMIYCASKSSWYVFV